MFVGPVSLNPENVITVPSARLVTVGYQRPCAMLVTSVMTSVAGSYTALRGSPKNGSYAIVPPLMKARPSARITMPLQNMSHPTGRVRIVPAFGSQTAAWKLVTVGSFPDPETTSTFPLLRSAMWTGLIGIV